MHTREGVRTKIRTCIPSIYYIFHTQYENTYMYSLSRMHILYFRIKYLVYAYERENACTYMYFERIHVCIRVLREHMFLYMYCLSRMRRPNTIR